MSELLNDLSNPGYLVFLAAAIQAAAMLFQGQISIRIFLLVGSIVYMTYYMIAADEPLWEAMIATLAMSIANICGLMTHLFARSLTSIPENQFALFSVLGGVEPWEFRSLMKHGHIRQVTCDETLTIEGEVPESLFFVIDGTIDIEQGSGRFRIPPRHFIGEVSLMLGTPASATAKVRAGAQIVEWSRKSLTRHMNRRSKLMVTVMSLLSRDMAQKVAESARRIDGRFANGFPVSSPTGQFH